MLRDPRIAARPGCSRAVLAALAALPLLLAAAPVRALVPDFGATATPGGEKRAPVASYRLPVGPFADGAIPTRMVEGAVTQTAWQLDTPGASALELLIPLREQVQAAGFRILFECETMACGGFDFRYGTENLPEPGMHVDLGDFRFLSAERDGKKGAEVLSLLVSRSATRGFVQLTLVGAAELAPATVASVAPDAAAPDAPRPAATLSSAGDPTGSPITAALDAGQSVVLDGLAFAPGKAELLDGDHALLADLAAWLLDDPARRVALVGHTDSSGSADANLALSRARAEAVRDVLFRRYAIDPARISARGMGPDSPRADNATAEGRAQNRRVEVDPTPTP